MPPARGEHGALGMEIAWRIKTFVVERGLGKVYGAETGFTLRRDADTVLAPDVAFVRTDRLPPPGQRRGFMAVAPDLVVETVSPSDRSAHVTTKVLAYLEAGGRLVWVIEQTRRSITAWTSDRRARALLGSEVLDGGDVLPASRCRWTRSSPRSTEPPCAATSPAMPRFGQECSRHGFVLP